MSIGIRIRRSLRVAFALLALSCAMTAQAAPPAIPPGAPFNPTAFSLGAAATVLGIDANGKTVLSSEKVRRVLGALNTAFNNNPYERPAMTSPPTIAVSATTDATLAASVAMVSSNALTSAASTKIAWYGGTPLPEANAYVIMPVTSVLPSTTGNIAGFANAFGVTNDMNAWANALETETDSDKIEFTIYLNNARKVMFQVDGQYVDFTGTTGLGASNADTFIKLTFASRKVRRIRVLLSTVPSSSPSMLKAIRVSATTASGSRPRRR